VIVPQQTILGTVASLSPLLVDVDGAETSIPAVLTAPMALEVDQRVQLALRTPYAPAIVGGQSGAGDLSADNFDAIAQTWVPSMSASESMTVSNVDAQTADYTVLGPWVFISLYVTFTLAGTPSTAVYWSLPESAAGSYASCLALCQTYDGSATLGFCYNDQAARMVTYKGNLTNWALGAGRTILACVYYKKAP
jgi:hypothetical protein